MSSKPSRSFRLAAVVVAAALLAGCTQPPPTPAPAVQPNDIAIHVAETGPDVGPDLNATTAAAPRLIEGEWWRIRFGSEYFAGGDAEVLRVVANATDEGYVFGMPHEGWMKEAISMHAPAFGDVALDLSYAVHNERFTPLVFPLEAGDTWETLFGPAGTLVATVESADRYTARIAFQMPPQETGATNNPVTDLMGLSGGDGVLMRITYDARIHEVTKFESLFGTWEVVGHGYEFRGWVSVPRGEHTAIDYGVFGPSADNPLPSRTVTVDDSFNRITVMHFIQAISPGLFRVSSTTPQGDTWVTELQGPGQKVFFFEVGEPGGAWQQEDITAGVGGTYTMGIAYQQYDILVPEGDRRPTHGHDVVR